MSVDPEIVLVAAVAAVGFLHTIVPDHWVPITLIARQRGWTQGETLRAALAAGTGHALSTLLIASAVWIAGVAFAQRFGHLVDTVASLALIAFGGWIALSSLRAIAGTGGHGHRHGRGHDHGHDHGHGHDHDDGRPEADPLYAPLKGETRMLDRHVHLHRHGRGPVHAHWHDHIADMIHPAVADGAEAPMHDHRHRTSARTALLVILGSSPMVEGIPAFFAAGKYGVGLILVMALVFAAATIATYAVLCVYSTAGLQRVRLGAFERHGETLSGAFIALVGVAFWIWPAI